MVDNIVVGYIGLGTMGGRMATNLQKAGAGWDLPLNDPGAFGQAIGEIAALDHEGYAARSKTARQFAVDYLDRSNPIEQYLKLFS